MYDLILVVDAFDRSRGFLAEAVSIRVVDRIVAGVRIEIDRSTPRTDGFFRGPPPDLGIVVPHAETNEPGVEVVQPAPEPEWLTSAARVRYDVPELVVVEALNDVAGGHVDDESRTGEVVADDPVRVACL